MFILFWHVVILSSVKEQINTYTMDGIGRDGMQDRPTIDAVWLVWMHRRLEDRTIVDRSLYLFNHVFVSHEYTVLVFPYMVFIVV